MDTPGEIPSKLVDYFISRAGPDFEWAIRITNILTKAGYRTFVQDKDIINTSFMGAMQDALTSGARTIALLSSDYLQRDHCAAEWQATIADDPLNRKSRLIVFRIGECTPVGLLKSLAYVDLLKFKEHDTLLEEVVLGAVRVRSGSQLPEVAASFWRDAQTITHPDIRQTTSFTGRGEAMADIDAAVTSGIVTAITQPVAVRGMGGIGKSTAARQYAWEVSRHGVFTGIWWFNSEKDKITKTYQGIERGLLDLRECLFPGASIPKDRSAAARSVMEHIQNAGYEKPWLLVYDNVDDLEVLEKWPPQNGCHVLITTRLTTFKAHVSTIELDAWSLEDSITYLIDESGRDIGGHDAEAISLSLGCLPLALSHAAAYLREMPAVSPASYAKVIHKHMAHTPPGLTESKAVYATLTEAVAQAERFVPGAAEVMSLAAYLAPDDIPLELYEQAPEHYPNQLAQVLADPSKFYEALSALVRFSLIKYSENNRTFSVHRLVQAATRGALENEEYFSAALHCCRASYPGAGFEHWRAYERLLPHARALSSATVASSSEVLAMVQYHAGYFLFERASYAEAESFFRRTLAMREEVLGLNDIEVAAAATILADLLTQRGKYNEVEVLHQRALLIREKAQGLHHPMVGVSLNNLAVFYHTRGLYAKAIPLYVRSIEIAKFVRGAKHIEVGKSLSNLAELYRELRRYEEAEPLYLESLEIGEQQLGPSDPSVGISLNNLALLYQATGRLEEAEPLCWRAIKLFEEAYGADHPHLGGALNTLAMIYHDQGKLDLAEPLYERDLAISRKLLGPDHPDVGLALHNIASLKYDLKRFSEAAEVQEQALKVLLNSLGQHHPSTKNAANGLRTMRQALK